MSQTISMRSVLIIRSSSSTPQSKPTTTTPSSSSSRHNAFSIKRRHALASTLLAGSTMIFNPRSSNATGLESIDLPSPSTPDFILDIQEKNRLALEKSEEAFQSSDLLKTLKERSDANRDARAKELRDKYCQRQSELGVGDCAGLRLIPGMTKSGVQKRPEWLDKLVYGDNGPSE